MDSNELLAKINELKARVEAYKSKVEDAKAKKAVIEDKLAELEKKLSARLGSPDWNKARKALDKLSEGAGAALEALADALDGIDLDFD